MNTSYAYLFLFTLFINTSCGQEVESDADDPFNLSEINKYIEEIGVPSLQYVSELDSVSLNLFQSGNCEEALPALEAYAKNANWLANIVSSGLEPYYGASYDSRKDYPYSALRPLIPYESIANGLKRKRNHSFVMQAECHEILGNRNQAVALYIKALKLISLDDKEWWDRSRVGLYDIVGVSQ